MSKIEITYKTENGFKTESIPVDDFVGFGVFNTISRRTDGQFKKWRKHNYVLVTADNYFKQERRILLGGDDVIATLKREFKSKYDGSANRKVECKYDAKGNYKGERKAIDWDYIIKTKEIE